MHQVITWILSGATAHEIAEAIAVNFPGSKAKPLILDAWDQIAESSEADPSRVKGWAIEATRAVYQKALSAADFGAALRALKQIVELSQ